MPITAEQERRLLNHYGINTINPEAWPKTDDDEDDDTDDDTEPVNGGPVRQPSKQSTPNAINRMSRYRNIDRHASIRSTSSMGPDSVVQKDEADPLGMAPSVAQVLRSKGIPVEEDLKLRNRFMLSSTSFSPALFLSQVHQDASTEDLLRGLDYLSRSIEQKSASLKVLVESNFEKFVKAKATIDNVYTEMRMQGQDDASTPRAQQSSGFPGGSRTPHSRHTSRGQTHFRSTSGAFSPTKAATSDKRKNALTKESEYGVLGIKVPLQEVAMRAEEVWGPALGGREKEDTMRQVLGALDRHRELFSLPATVAEAVRINDYDTVVASWKSAMKYADRAREMADEAKTTGTSLTEQDAQQILITAKMWRDVSDLVDAFKRTVWKRLRSSHGRKPAAVADETDREEHMELIGVLLQLGVDENPIWQWLNSRYLYLKDRIARSFERSRIEIEILRRRLASNERQDSKKTAQYLKAASNNNLLPKSRQAIKETDTAAVIAFWEKVHASINTLLDSSQGILGEVLEFWETAQSFINNKAQKSFPTAVFAAGLEHLELEPDDVASLRSGAVELVDQIRESVMAFFTDAPVDDLSDLYSPIPPTPISPDSAGSKDLTPSSRRAFTFDSSNAPPPSAKKGEAWEKFAFWAPYANALSGSHYLSRILTLVGTAMSELAALSVVKQDRSTVEGLKVLVNAARERCIHALCAAWQADAGDRCKYLESWQRTPDRKDLTTFTALFMAYEERVLANFQKVAYLSDASGSGTAEVIISPPTKLLQGIRGCFVTSLYKILSGMVDNAERNKCQATAALDVDPDGITTGGYQSTVGDGIDVEGAVDASNINVRMLMTLSNLAHLRSDIIPHLISQFESAFSVKLTDESKTIHDALGQIDAREFKAYVKPTIAQLDHTITTGIHSPNWPPPPDQHPTTVRPYVHEVLLQMVLVHSEVTTTASSLTNQILSYLLEHASAALLHAFTTRTPAAYHLSALMQATLDVEFLAQTLNNYTTDRAGELQGQIYVALDERTDEESRRRLQGELPEMRGVLKRLREGSRVSFGCFRRERRGRTGVAAAAVAPGKAN